MWLMVQQDEPGDYVLATGETTEVSEFCQWAFEDAGIPVEFRGKGVDEKGYCTTTGQCLVEVDPRYFRPTEVDLLIGDATKAKEKLGWVPKYNLQALVADMMQSDLHMVKKDDYLKKGGFKTLNYFE